MSDRSAPEIASPSRFTRRHKVMAILAAGTVVGVGATVTLAAWNDAEWVRGIVGTATFEVQQNTSSPWAAGAWTDVENSPGGAMTFAPGNLVMTPSNAVYAPVSLTTTAASVAAASLTLGAPTSAGAATTDAGGLLFSALTLRVVVAPQAAAATPAACNASSFAAGANFVVGSATAAAPLATAGAVTPALAAAGADKQNYCFEIVLPAGAPDALQGRAVAPEWKFVAESVGN